MAKLQVHQFGCRSDNFGVLVHDPEIGVTASIDAPEAAAVNSALSETGWTLSHILVTHHHYDHVDGIAALKKDWGAIVVANVADAGRIKGVDMTVECGRSLQFGTRQADFIDTPGHTIGHVAIHFAADKLLFCGDTLFSMGCGRLFEGSAKQMHASLEKLASFDDDTMIYCGHEYTKANCAFALSVDGDNAALQERCRQVDALRAENRPTLPVSLATEKATNPFLRTGDSAIRAHLGMQDASAVEVFAALRARKDNF